MIAKINETLNANIVGDKLKDQSPDIHSLVLHQNLLIQGLMDLLYQFVSTEMEKTDLFSGLKKLLKQHQIEMKDLGLRDDLAIQVNWAEVDPKGILTSGELHPVLVDKVKGLVQKASSQGLKIRLQEGLRSFERQNELFKSGRNVTRARAGNSYHNYGLAIDIVFRDKNNQPSWSEEHDWLKLGKIGKDLGLKWGGDFKRISDKAHFEYHPELNLKMVKEAYRSGGLQNVWSKIPSPLEGEG